MTLSAPVAAQDLEKGQAAFRAGDFATALQEWTPLAEAGDAEAQFNLGTVYHKGVLQDYKESLKWFTLAAEQELSLAQIMLGIKYWNGFGVLQDNTMAHMWFNIASANGDELGGINRDIVAKEMTQADISKAQAMARECMSSDYKNCRLGGEIKTFEFEEVIYSFEDSTFCIPEPNSPFDRLFKDLDRAIANVDNNYPTVFRLAACEKGKSTEIGTIVKPYMYIKRVPLPAAYKKLEDTVLFEVMKVLLKTEAAQRSHTPEQKKELRKLLKSIERETLSSKEMSELTILEDNQNRFILSSIIETPSATSIALMHPAVADGTVFTITLSMPTGFEYDLDQHIDLLHKWAISFKVQY